MPEHEKASDLLSAYTTEQLSRVRLENACVAYQTRIARLEAEFKAKADKDAKIIKELMTQVKELMPVAKQLERADTLLAQKNATLGHLTEKLMDAEQRVLDLGEKLRYERGRRFT